MSTTSPLELLREAERLQAERGHGHDAFLSRACGFLPIEPPASSLPPEFAAWDQLAGQLPTLTRDGGFRHRVASLPRLDAARLPDASLGRAASLLAHFAHCWARAGDETFVEVPATLMAPWTLVSQRLGRESCFLSFKDVIAFNWRLVDARGPRRIENLRLLVPVTGNEAERVSQLCMAEMLGDSGPLLDGVARVCEAVLANEADAALEGLRQVRDAVQGMTWRALPKMDPNPWSRTYTNPAVWGKLVAPFGAPTRRDEPGFSGAGAPPFQLLDCLFSRPSYASVIGRETLHQRKLMPALVQRFFEAVQAVDLHAWVRDRGTPAVRAAYRHALDAYAGDRGFLGQHRLKLYGYMEIAFRAGRGASNGGLPGGGSRAWDLVDDHMEVARRERLGKWSLPAARAPRLRAQTLARTASSSRIRRVTFDIGETGLEYQAGDRVAVLVRHTHELVARTVEALRAAPDTPVTLDHAWHERLAVLSEHEPLETLPLRELLALGQLRSVSRATAQVLYRSSRSPELERILDAREESRWELWAMLALIARSSTFDPARLFRAPASRDDSLARLVPPEPWRLYSIASSPRASAGAGGPPRRLSVTIGEVRHAPPPNAPPAAGGDPSVPARLRGAASTFLGRSLAPDDQPVPLRIHRPARFELPEDPAVPVVLVGAGTGVSPMMSFLRHRVLTNAPGRNVLLVAAREADGLLFDQELRDFVARRRVEFHVAFSRQDLSLVDRGGRLVLEAGRACHLPDVMRRAPLADALYRLMLDREDGGEGGCFFVSGKSTFAQAIQDTLEEIFAARGACDGGGGAAARGDDAAARAVEQTCRMTGQRRLMLDVFTAFTPPVERSILASEVVRHNGPADGYWMVLDGQVYDLTRYLQVHPGGAQILAANAGVDATAAFEKIGHHLSPEVRSRLDMCRIGHVRRLDFGAAWGWALLPEGLRAVTLRDAYRRVVRLLFRVVEAENLFQNELGLQRIALTDCEAPGERTGLKIRLLLDAHRRTLREVLPALIEGEYCALSRVVEGLFAPDAPVGGIARDVAALQAGPARQAALGALTLAQLDLEEFGRDPVPSAEHERLVRYCHVVERGDARILADLKGAFAATVAVFERHEASTLRAAAELFAAFRAVPEALARGYERLGRDLSGD